MGKPSYCVSCKRKTDWVGGAPSHKKMHKHNTLMLHGKCSVCNKKKTTIAPQKFKKSKFVQKKKPNKTRSKRGKSVALAKAVLMEGVPRLLDMVRRGVGSQGGNSAGSKASYSRFGWPPR